MNIADLFEADQAEYTRAQYVYDHDAWAQSLKDVLNAALPSHTARVLRWAAARIQDHPPYGVSGDVVRVFVRELEDMARAANPPLV